MGDASMSVEQEISPTHQQEGSASLSQHIDLDAFYQTEVDRYKKEQALPGKKVWELLEKTAIDKTSSGDYQQQEPGTAQSPDPKIGTLARVLNMKAGAHKIDQLQTIINNPDYLDFVAYLVQNKIAMSGDKVPILDNIVALDKAGVLKPAVNLYRSGVLLASDYHNEPTRKLFEGKDAANYNSQKIQKEAIGDMKYALRGNSKLIQEFLQDPQKKEFVGLLADLRRKPITLSELSMLEYLCGTGLSRKKEAVYILKLTQGNKEKSAPADPLDLEFHGLEGISQSQDIMEVLTNKDFPVFLRTLREKIGHILDLSNPSLASESTITRARELARIFADPALRQGLLQESTLEIIKSLYPNGNLFLTFIKDYIQLGNNPNALRTIHALKELGGNFSFSPNDVQLIANNPDTLSKLTSPEFKSVIKSLANYNYKFNFNFSRFQELKLLSESPNKERIFQVLDLLKENLQFSYKPDLLPYYIKLAQIPDVENKLRQLGGSALENLLQEKDLPTFVKCQANIELYQAFTQQETVSAEFAKISFFLLPLLAKSSNPQEAFSQIKAVFEKNNLPGFAKNLKIFEILYLTKEDHGLSRLEGLLKHSEGPSPVLKNSSDLRRIDTIYRDLLRISIDCGDLSLRSYLHTLQEGQRLLEKSEKDGVGSLSSAQMVQIASVLNRLNVLYENSLLGRKNQNKSKAQLAESINEQIGKLKTDLNVREQQTIMDRIAEMFLKPLGYSSIEDVLLQMDKAKEEAHSRNVLSPDISQGRLDIHAGDLLKGIPDDSVFGYILQSGSVAREYLGTNADSDATPFDTDVGIVLEEKTKDGSANVTEVIDAKTHGDLIILIRDRGQFIRTDKQAKINLTYDPKHYELFPTFVEGKSHFGIRTGFPSTEIDAVILKWSLLEESQEGQLARQEIFFNIANNGFYIPVVNSDGKVIFTESNYNTYRLNPESIQTSLSNTDFKPKEFIDILKASPYLKTLYEMSAGVSEGYRIDEHTVMAMNQFEKYFASNFDSTFMTRDDFRLMLSFHDAAKGLAVHSTGSATVQHEYTRKVLTYALQTTGLSTNKIDSVLSLVDQDILGGYIKGNRDAQTSAKEINNLAATIGVLPSELLKTLRMFYICDAGSYTADAGGKVSLDHLFQFHPEEHRVEFSKDTEEKYQRLVQEVLH